mgnify:CR=1 FL=1
MVKSETTTMEKRVKSQALEKFVHNKRAVFGVIVVLVIALCCLLLPLVMDLDPYTTDELAGFNSAPSAEHILGTDDVGRDLFARLLYGGRISLFVGIASTIISVLIGVPLGLLAGYYRAPSSRKRATISSLSSPRTTKRLRKCWTSFSAKQKEHAKRNLLREGSFFVWPF